MTKLTRAKTSHESILHKPEQPASPTATNWLKLGNAEACHYTDWNFDENTLYVQTGNSDSSEEQSVPCKTPQSRENPYFCTNDQAEVTRTDSVPEYVFCSVIVSIHKCAASNGISPKSGFLYLDLQQIRWQDTVEHDRLRKITDVFVQQQEPVRKREYLSTGRVRLLEQTQRGLKEVDSCTVETRMQWQRFLPRMVARFCGLEKMTPFFLELHTDYEWFSVVGDPDFQDGRLYINAIQNTLTTTVLRNFEAEEYWSKKLLKRLFDHETVRKLVVEYVERKRCPTDTTQQPVPISDADRDRFAKWLSTDRIRLLAAIIRINADLDCLYNLMERCKNGDAADIKDSQIPLRPEIYESFLDSNHHPSFRHIQAGFGPIDFPEPMKAMDVRKNDLIPIYFDQKQRLGCGGTSDVFKATIHSDYHAFSSNKNEVFALKIPKRFDIEDARNEVKNWQRFARVPHPHINTFHTCWIQKDKFYMLSPLAELTLEEFLHNFESPNLLLEAGGILEQLEGIASAIQHIHHVGRAGWDSSRTTTDKIDNGYHHDLKPANILIFGGKHWKITDFGTARVRQFRSSSPQTGNFYTLNLPRGDEQYGGPDRYTVETGPRRVGGAYDIWSFGCIILEVLLWSFGKTGDDLVEFRMQRAEDELNMCNCQPKKQSKRKSRKESTSDSDLDEEPPIQIPTFWYQCKKRADEFHLKPSVLGYLKLVKEQSRKRYPVLAPLYNLVKDMLNVNAKKRPAASVILSQLGILRVRAGAYFAKKRKEAGYDEAYADENLDFDMQTNYDSYARSSRMGSPPPSDGGTMDPGSSGQPSQLSSLKRRRASSTNSYGGTGPMLSEAGFLSHAGDNLSSQAPLPKDTKDLELSGETRQPLKKQRSDSQMSIKIEVDDIDMEPELPLHSSAPESSNRRGQTADDRLSPVWKKKGKQVARPNQSRSPSVPDNPRDLTWIEKQFSSSASGP